MIVHFSPLQPKNGESLEDLSDDVRKLIECLYDNMTECVYQRPITSFAVEMKPQPVFEVDILAEGRAALERANHDLGGSVTLSKLPLCLLFLFTVFSRVLMCCNLHPSFLSFPTSAGFCGSCEYTVSTYSCHMTLFINRLESQDSSGAAHYLTRACLLVSEVM